MGEQEQFVQVIAPATLQAGYTFQATIDNGRTVTVTVPHGGVKEGQVFSVPLDPIMVVATPVSEATPLWAAGSSVAATASSNTTSILPAGPRGAWRDGLFDCCTLGPCHPSLWNAMCCPQILMAQVLTRMNMTWLGQRSTPNNQGGSSHNNTTTFRNVVMLVIAYWILSTLLRPDPSQAAQVEVVGDQVVVHPSTNPPLQSALYNVVSFCFGLYTLIVLCALRGAVRHRYAIPTQTCCPDDMEDFCCAWACSCCTVAQLARHTAEYHEQRALCCSTTGLPATLSPPIVVVV